MQFPLAADFSEVRYIYIYSAALIVLLVIGFAGYSFLKRWMSQSDQTTHIGFSLADLREMHRQGQISDEEFERTKTKMVSSAKKMTERMPEVLPRRTPKPPAEGDADPPIGR